GGLRDIEFAVQLLALVHGRADEMLRIPGTLAALDALARGGYVGRGDAADLAAAYRFLRAVEHLLQLRQLRRTHTLPEDPAVLRIIGRALRHMRRGTRPAGPAGLPRPEAASERLEALGYADPAGALRHIEALTAGMSRTAAIQRTLLPTGLGWFADAPEPDAGLLAFRQVSESLGRSPWYLRLLRDNTAVAQRMARLLASSRYVTGLLLGAPEAVAMLGDDDELTPRPAAALHAEVAAVARRHTEPAEVAAAALVLRRRE